MWRSGVGLSRSCCACVCADGQMLPTKKGISLTRAQWSTVVDQVRMIDEELERIEATIVREPAPEDHGFRG